MPIETSKLLRRGDAANMELHPAKETSVRARSSLLLVATMLLACAAAPAARAADCGSGSQAALPALALRERGFKGPLFGSPAMLNADFIRIAGKSADGMLVSAGPSIVAEQLPDSH